MRNRTDKERRHLTEREDDYDEQREHDFEFEGGGPWRSSESAQQARRGEREPDFDEHEGASRQNWRRRQQRHSGDESRYRQRQSERQDYRNPPASYRQQGFGSLEYESQHQFDYGEERGYGYEPSPEAARERRRSGLTGFGFGMAGYAGGQAESASHGQHTGKGPKGYRRADDRILEEVSDQLTAHGDIDPSDVEVKVENGEVTLIGRVDGRHAKRLAEEIAENVSGVVDVINQIRVRRHGHGQPGLELPTNRQPETPPSADQ